jgi:hypothetical protein
MGVQQWPAILCSHDHGLTGGLPFRALLLIRWQLHDVRRSVL